MPRVQQIQVTPAALHERGPDEPTASPLYTIGHSNRSFGALCEILHAYQIRGLVDIRRFPRSRTNPQFNGDVLAESLRAEGIGYTYVQELGGRRSKTKQRKEADNAGWRVTAFHNYADYAETEPFAESLQTLLQLAAREPSAVMCAEALWWRCHRRIVADHVLAHGVPVIHLFTATKAEAATLTPFAHVDANARVTYPAPDSSDA